MKKIIIIVGLILISFSCSNTPIAVADSNKETTLEIQQLANQDTNCYKVVELNDILYVLQDQKVVIKVSNDSGALNSILLVFLLIWLLVIIIALILNQ
jgi:PBP1b-binding outer membrane lipoprotein LpoB